MPRKTGLKDKMQCVKMVKMQAMKFKIQKMKNDLKNIFKECGEDSACRREAVKKARADIKKAMHDAL
jgi:hypothetical protein